MKKERDFKGIWIPKGIWLASNLTAIQKVLLAEIDSLSRLEAGCFASNEYFGEFLGLKECQTSRLINDLQEKGYIKITIVDRNKRSMIVLQYGGGIYSSTRGDSTPVLHNNIVNNTTTLNTPPSESVADLQRKIQNKQDAHRMAQIVIWAEERRGKPFVNKPKQFAAIKRMKIAGIKPNEIQDRWEELEQDRFYSEKGFDFVTIANSFDKK